MNHSMCNKNKELLKVVEKGACFSCENIFDTKDIKEWTDSGQTAICPKCGVDSVVPVDDTFSKQKLHEMHQIYF